MKSVLLIVLAFTISGKSFAQDKGLDIKIESVAVSKTSTDSGKIIIHVDGDNPGFIFRLFDKAPWDGGSELAVSDPTDENIFVFENLNAGKYMVCVTDYTKVTRCEYITVKQE